MSKVINVGVIGAGIAGLYSALLLRREGHNVTVFEANNRIGGRIHTHRFQPLPGDEDVYFEAGAMRIPQSALHSQVYHLIQYLNTHSAQKYKVELIPYVLEHENNPSYIHDTKLSIDSINLASKFNLPEEYQGKSARELLGEVVTPWLELMRRDFDQGFTDLLKFDEFSFRSYLLQVVGWPHEVIEFVELMLSQTNQYALSFTEIIMQNLDFDTKDWTTVRGGMSCLAESAANLVDERNIHLNSPVNGIAELASGQVSVSISGPNPHVETFDKVILAIPAAALQNIPHRPTWSFMKEQSIRGAHFEPLYKMGLHFRTRFWEQPPFPSFGGQSATDLRIRWVVYPSNDIGGVGSGVLLIYSWMTDASRWEALAREDRIDLALHDLQRFFADKGVDVYEQFVTAFDVCWSSKYATGDAMFLPGQFSRFYSVARKPEGNIHFAGEHLSRQHTWIVGAIDSALHTVCEVQGVQDLTALGEEYLSAVEQQRRKQVTYISSRRYLSSYIIPHHNNLQYVKETTTTTVVPLKA